jgi:hypothetical protein
LLFILVRGGAPLPEAETAVVAGSGICQAHLTSESSAAKIPIDVPRLKKP